MCMLWDSTFVHGHLGVKRFDALLFLRTGMWVLSDCHALYVVCTGMWVLSDL